MKSRTNSTVPLLILALLSLSFGPCNESLPVYEEPARIFSGKTEGSYRLTVAENGIVPIYGIPYSGTSPD